MDEFQTKWFKIIKYLEEVQKQYDSTGNSNRKKAEKFITKLEEFVKSSISLNRHDNILIFEVFFVIEKFWTIIKNKSQTLQTNIIFIFQIAVQNLKPHQLNDLFKDKSFLQILADYLYILSSQNLKDMYISVLTFLVNNADAGSYFDSFKNTFTRIVLNKDIEKQVDQSFLRGLFLKLCQLQHQQVKFYRGQSEFSYIILNFFRQFKQDLLLLDKKVLELDFVGINDLYQQILEFQYFFDDVRQLLQEEKLKNFYDYIFQEQIVNDLLLKSINDPHFSSGLSINVSLMILHNFLIVSQKSTNLLKIVESLQLEHQNENVIDYMYLTLDQFRPKFKAIKEQQKQYKLQMKASNVFYEQLYSFIQTKDDNLCNLTVHIIYFLIKNNTQPLSKQKIIHKLIDRIHNQPFLKLDTIYIYFKTVSASKTPEDQDIIEQSYKQFIDMFFLSFQQKTSFYALKFRKQYLLVLKDQKQENKKEKLADLTQVINYRFLQDDQMQFMKIDIHNKFEYTDEEFIFYQLYVLDKFLKILNKPQAQQIFDLYWKAKVSDMDPEKQNTLLFECINFQVWQSGLYFILLETENGQIQKKTNHIYFSDLVFEKQQFGSLFISDSNKKNEIIELEFKQRSFTKDAQNIFKDCCSQMLVLEKSLIERFLVQLKSI